MVTCLLGYLVGRLLGFLVTCLLGCSFTWLFGCLGAWLLGCLVTWLFFTWLLGCLLHGYLVVNKQPSNQATKYLKNQVTKQPSKLETR